MATTDSTVWRERGTPLVAGSGTGPLRGVRLAVKDVHAVAGHKQGAGNPARLAEAEPQPSHSWAVAALLDAGADITGIAQTDEFAYSLNGTNAHYGTPPNPAAPGRVPGGSSSGPAAAVALGEADAGLGSDTAGSIRVPSSYCGLYGLRPTHGLVPTTGMLPLAPSFDTVAWLARDADTLARLGDVLLPAGGDEGQRPFRTALVAADLLALADEGVREAFGPAAADLAERLGLRIEEVPSLGGDPGERAAAFATAQGAEVWECDGAWVSAHPGTLGPGVEARFARAAAVTPEERAAAEAVVHRTARELRAALPEDAVLLVPAAGSPAPLIDEDPERKAATRQATFRLTCLASGAGLPCLVLPRMSVDGLPVGLAVIAGRGSDRALLELAGVA
ncbi:amidase [Streptomyces sp. NBC_01210]|uniref:amidase n=1 Tax=Streptomyces sp. NBC_01210 TaxID=2903774 RepID=UPI002E0DD1E2|nr:amidase [Streptomyces sp. NBC_01210]